MGFSVTLLLFACKKSENIAPVPTQTSQGSTDISSIHICMADMYRISIATPAPAAVGERADFWPNNTTGPTVLRVSFIDNLASELVRSKIKMYSKVWEKYSNIRFDYVSSNQTAEIRISCVSGAGSWSYPGKQNLNIPANQATMNYGWFTDDTSEEEFSRVIVHEFGHALGLGHEQCNPVITMQWNKPYVYNYYLRTNGWSKDAVDANVFYTYPASLSAYSQYDPTSIMHYPVPKEFTLNGMSVGLNTQLSEIDKSFIQKTYPFPRVAPAETTLYNIAGFTGYIYNILVNNTLTVKSDADKNIVLYSNMPLYPLDYSWKNDWYVITDESGYQYTFSSKTVFNAKTTTALKGAITIVKNGQQVFSNLSPTLAQSEQ